MNYVAKLIYLPDRTQPMAVNVHSGLIGTSSIQLDLQNGWMLTSVNGSSDNKVAETLTAVGTIIAALKGTGSSSGGGGGGGGGSNKTGGVPIPGNILLPGLYAFDYDKKTGELAGFCAAQTFGPRPPVGHPYGSVPLCNANGQVAEPTNGGAH
ncbi:hypothetical protein [Paraburkholderia sp. GAS206C]|uniref:hypothetical protein n=1 Tax=unclassified Paraburkholderia TaxID=2615204 RepID=UPI003D1E3393